MSKIQTMDKYRGNNCGNCKHSKSNFDQAYLIHVLCCTFRSKEVSFMKAVNKFFKCENWEKK